MKVNMMVQRSIILLLLVVVLAGCKDESRKPKENVQPPGLIENVKEDITEEKPFVSIDSEGGKIVWNKDAAEMVRIPEVFEIIPSRTEPAAYDEFGNLIKAETLIPEKMVKVGDAFFMDTTEVTVGQFKKFLKSSGYKPEYPMGLLQFDWNEVYKYSPTDKYPMILVSWHDATAYAKWVGKRLPAEAEWEFAARGGLVGKEFPWGDTTAVSRDYANYDGTGGKDKWEYCAPVGSFKPNGYGLYDMGGNIWEWCQDRYDSDKTRRILRGGSWYGNTVSLRAAFRFGNGPSNAGISYGFRCVSGFPAAQQ